MLFTIASILRIVLFLNKQISNIRKLNLILYLIDLKTDLEDGYFHHFHAEILQKLYTESPQDLFSKDAHCKNAGNIEFLGIKESLEIYSYVLRENQMPIIYIQFAIQYDKQCQTKYIYEI